MRDDGEIAAAAAFKAAVLSGDLAAFLDALGDVERHWAWEKAFRAVARVPAAPHLRQAFVEAVMAGGDALRSHTNNDRVLLNALQNLLPPYDASSDAPKVLFRGTSRNERRCRRYGHSWTDDLSVARSHAVKNPHDGSGAVFETEAPPQAIICALWQASVSFHEREFVLDRRLLNDVRIREEVQGPVRPREEPLVYSDEVLRIGRFVSLRRI